MKVYLCKDIPQIGIAGEIIKVNDGYARNYLIPRGLAMEVTLNNESQYLSKAKHIENRKEVIATETSILAEKINSLSITFKRKMHDDGKLYGAISSAEIVTALGQKGISVSKSQVKIDKSIKSKGSHKVLVKLTSRLQPELTVVVSPE